MSRIYVKSFWWCGSPCWSIFEERKVLEIKFTEELFQRALRSKTKKECLQRYEKYLKDIQEALDFKSESYDIE